MLAFPLLQYDFHRVSRDLCLSISCKKDLYRKRRQRSSLLLGWIELLQFLAALAILHQTIRRIGCLALGRIEELGAIQPVLQIVLVHPGFTLLIYRTQICMGLIVMCKIYCEPQTVKTMVYTCKTCQEPRAQHLAMSWQYRCS